jgi:hypothetical protein
MSAPDLSEQLRKKTTQELLRWTASWKVGCHENLAGQHEIQRRRDHGTSMRGWIAIGISVVSLIVAICALLRK